MIHLFARFCHIFSIMLGLSVASIGVAAEQELKRLVVPYGDVVQKFHQACLETDGLYYQQHRRSLLSQHNPIVYDVPEVYFNRPFTTTRVWASDTPGVNTYIELAYFDKSARCSLVMDAQASILSMVEFSDMLNDLYGDDLRFLSSDNVQEFWDLNLENRDVVSLTLLPKSSDDLVPRIELTRNFNISPMRMRAPLNKSDLDNYLYDENSIIALSLRLYATSPRFADWLIQTDRFPHFKQAQSVVTDEQGAHDVYTRMLSTQPKLESRLIQNDDSQIAIILFNQKDYDFNQLSQELNKQLPFFFQKLDFQTVDTNTHVWYVERNQIREKITLRGEQSENIQTNSLTFFVK